MRWRLFVGFHLQRLGSTHSQIQQNVYRQQLYSICKQSPIDWNTCIDEYLTVYENVELVLYTIYTVAVRRFVTGY